MATGIDERLDLKQAGATGVVAVVIAAVASAGIGHLWDFPPTDATAAEITAYLGEDRTRGIVAMILNTVAVGMWLVVGAAVWLRMRRAAGGETFYSACFGLSFAAMVTLVFAGFVPFMVMLYRLPGVAEAKLLYDLTFAMLAMSGVPTAVALVVYAEFVFRTRGLPRATAWFAVVGAAAHVVLLASFAVEEGFFSLQGQVITAIPATLFAWIFATSVALARGR